jgi:hypothetical protein
MFTKRQLEQIHQGKCEGVNVEVYLDPDINEIDMWLVRKMLLQDPTLEKLIKQFVLNKEVTKHMKDYKVYQGLWAVSCLKNEPIEVITLAFQPGMTSNDVTEYVGNALNKYTSSGHQKKLMNRLCEDQFDTLKGEMK